MNRQAEERIHVWLDEASTAMGGDAGSRRDVLLELETSIQEQVDERTRSGQIPEQAVQDVLDALGDPAELGASYAPARPLLAPHHSRSFLVNLAVLFAVHFLLVVGATLVGHDLSIYPLRIAPIADARNWLELLSRAVETLFLDAGLLLCVFAAVPRVGRLLRFPRATLTVRPDARRCLESAFFLALVLVVVNFLRDNLLALYIPGEAGATQVPLVGPGLVENILFFNLWIGLAIARDLVYARLGERPATLGLDIVSNSVGLFCLLRVAATKQLVDLAQAHEALGTSADGLEAILNAVLVLIALVAAALLAARIVRRVLRVALLRK